MEQECNCKIRLTFLYFCDFFNLEFYLLTLNLKENISKKFEG